MRAYIDLGQYRAYRFCSLANGFSMDTSDFVPTKVEMHNNPVGLIGSVRAVQKNALAIIPDIALQQPILSGFTGKRWHMIMDPGAMRQILLDNVGNYPKSLATRNVLGPAIGKSMFVAEGAHWRWQRRAVAPVFSPRNIRNLSPIMSHAAQRSVDRIAAAGRGAVDLHDEMATATFEVISDVTFTGNDGLDRDMVHRALERYLETGAKMTVLDMIDAPTWVPRFKRTIAAHELKYLKAQADRVINDRKTKPSADMASDLLDLLVHSKDPETDRGMTTDELRDNLLTFILAGHETTALALSWALYLLANHPHYQERAIEEAKGQLNGRIAGEADLAHLPFIRQIIDETMRLYPPAAIVSRTAMDRDVLCGRQIRKGDTMILPLYALHRSRLLWQDPDLFIPERFENPKSIDRFAYIPFIDGPRVCIGAQFAINEAVIILASILTRFRFRPVVGKVPDPVMVLTLRPEGGVWLTAEPV